MIPIGPLMREHRLIERLIRQMRLSVDDLQSRNRVELIFIDAVVDFFGIYADRCHHGKEEDILFRELTTKQLDTPLKRTMDELIEEHRVGRALVRDLLEVKGRYVGGDDTALEGIIRTLKKLTEFYPKHIFKEDKQFFYPCMEYFSKEEKDRMLREFWDFDRQLIHEKYQAVIEQWERWSLKRAF